MYSLLGTFEGKKLLPKNPHNVTRGESGFVPFGRDSFPHEKGSTVQSLYTCLFSLRHTIPEQPKAIAFAGRL